MLEQCGLFRWGGNTNKNNPKDICKKYVLSEHIIALFNIIVGLKPKGKWDSVKDERVVPHFFRLFSTKGSEKILVDLKYGNRDITGSSSAFAGSKDW